MDIGTLLSVIQNVLTALNSSLLKDAWSLLGGKSDLDALSSVAATVKKVLLDAEAKYDELSSETLQYVEELRDALYDADDLLDELLTLTKQKQLMGKDHFIKKVRLFFSRYNQLGVAYKMSQGVQRIMNKLDEIASKHTKFGLNLDHKPIRRKRKETCSSLDTEIVGRDDDVENIVRILLNPVVQRDVSFTTVVGMGGLGKTALAQLVYKHEKITKEFPLRLWTCVSDHDQSILDVKAILAQIIESATGQKYNKFSMEVVVNRLQEVLAQGRFLIVLDDLWSESRDDWRMLAGHLVGCGRGCQVLVTTRSKETAKIVGNGLMYELKGLSFENSWHLFQMMAFEQVSSNCNVDLIKIGQDIVKKCANVPLALRVIGALLYGQEKSKWVSIQKLGLADLREDQNVIMPILKLSYHNLQSPLKSCFTYCTLYPKDFEIKKELLISLWIAQGYIVPLEKGQSIEDASEEYFSILLQRCFFQDVHKDEYGKIISFKLHDLLHDVAFEVARKEICPASSFTGDVDKVVRHASLIRRQYASYSFTKSHIRTYLHIDTSYTNNCAEETLVTILANYKCLRTLDLSYLGIKTLPDSIGKLIHLRSLDISGNPYMEVLPNSIKKLYNLQSLNLNFCMSLKALPKGLSKLINLTVLKLSGCDSLKCMPFGMGKLTDLYKLSNFVVGEMNSSVMQHVQLEGLKPLKKLRGSIVIDIHFPESGAFVKDDTVRERGYITDKEHLDKIRFECKHEGSNEQAADNEEELLGSLQPHANLKELELVKYRGAKMPRWGKVDSLATSLPNLVRLLLYDCSEIQCLPSLQKLFHLKRLALVDLPNLEYVESQPATGSREEVLLSLPRLEQLRLLNLPKLKLWCLRSTERVGGDDSSGSNEEPHQSSIVLSQLNFLDIAECPELTSLLHCPNVEKLRLYRFNEKLQILKIHTYCLNLREVRTDNIAWLHSSLPVESFWSLTYLGLNFDKDVESLTEFGQVFSACSSSLRSLRMWGSPKLQSVFGGLVYLTDLESLSLHSLPIVNLADEANDDMPWGFCRSLLTLDISYCKELHTFPTWMQKLTSIRDLNVVGCSDELYERCRNPNGEAWPNIQHIPSISVTCSRESSPKYCVFSPAFPH